MFTVATFYHFTPLDDLPSLQQDLTARARAALVCGTCLIAPEGLNATLASPDAARFEIFVADIVRQFSIPPQNLKWSTAHEQPFARLKIRIKREIITLKRPNVDARTTTGRHVRPADWNDLITRPDVLVLDTRNDYETAYGTFAGATVPPLKTFADFADYVDTLNPDDHPCVAMFCTGGIRCEKASSYMMARGFKDVAQLEGGILKYLETIPPEQSQWQGSCFVFDERVALGHRLEEVV